MQLSLLDSGMPPTSEGHGAVTGSDCCRSLCFRWWIC